MSAGLYHGKIEHTEKTITALYRAEYHAYELKRMVRWMIYGFAMVLFAAFVNLPIWAKGLLMLVGAWLMMSTDFPAQMRADKAIEARRGSLPVMEYTFFEDHVTVSGEGSMSIPYEKFTRLTTDADYLYLFINKNSICMMERRSVEPDDIKGLMEHVEDKTGLVFRLEKTVLSMNLQDILQTLRKKGAKE